MSDNKPAAGEKNGYKYWAFISYSHQDNLTARKDGTEDHIRWADWLHEQLETYRVPGGYQNRTTPTGEPMPKRFFPVFRDEAELPTSHNLGEQIHDALDRSRFLIVIASPRSAKSQYVNEEVRYFREIGRGDRILTLIVDGEPNVRLSPKAGWTAEDECFCPAVVHPLREDGSVDESTVLREEPLSADTRVKLAVPREMRASENRQAAQRTTLKTMKLKLVAGMMGVGLDELVQRDAQRRIRQMVITTAVSAILLVVLTALGGYGFWANERAKSARKQAAVVANQSLYQRYVSDMQGAHALWQAGEFDKLAAMLADYEKPGDFDPRGFEWYYWRSLGKPKHLFEYTAAEAHFTEVAFDPEGHRLAAINSGKVIVWDIQTGHELYRLSEPANSVTFTRDGKQLIETLTAGGGMNLQLYDAGDGHKITDMGSGKFALNPNNGIVIDGNFGRISSFFSFPDGKYQGDVTGLPSMGGRMQSEPNLHGLITDMGFDTWGRHLAVGYSGGEILIWRPDAQMVQSRGPIKHSGPVVGVTFSADGRLVASQSMGQKNDNSGQIDPGEAKLWVAANGKILSESKLTVKKNRAIDMPWTGDFHQGEKRPAISPDGTRWYVADDDGVKVLDTTSSTLLYTLDHSAEPTVTFALSSDGKRVASANIHSVRVSEAANPANRIVLKFGGELHRFGLSVDEKQIVAQGTPAAGGHSREGLTWQVGMQGEELLAWNANTGSNLLRRQIGKVLLTPPQFKSDNSAIDYGAFEYGIGPGSNELVAIAPLLSTPRNYPSNRPPQKRLEFEYYNESEVSQSLDGKFIIKTWDSRTRKNVTTLKTNLATGQAFQAEGQRVEGLLRLVLIRKADGSRTNLIESDTASVRALAISPDSKWAAAVASTDGAIQVWSMPDGIPGPTLQDGHGGEVTALQFSPDGTLLASGSADRTVMLWEVKTGRRRFTFAGHRREVSGLAFLPNGQRLVSCGGSSGGKYVEPGDVRLWDVNTGQSYGELPMEGAQTVSGIAVSKDGKRIYASVNDMRGPEEEILTPRPAPPMAEPFGKIICWEAAANK